MPTPDATMQRLEDQIKWYDQRSTRNQRLFKSLKVTEILAAAVIPFAAGAAASPYFTGALGVLIVILEGLQHLNQFQHQWITYRSTCEDLKHEKYLYLSKAGPYTMAPDAHVLLAERIETLVSREHAQWISAQQQADKTKRASGSNVS
jgi:hypothetical protein